MKKKFLTALAAACLMMSGTAAAVQFADVPADAWYADTVSAAYESGIMQGMGDTFQPEGTITIAEGWVLAARLHALSHGGDGVFLAGKTWYAAAQTYLQQQGVLDTAFQTLVRTQGQADALLPNDPASRLYLAELLALTAGDLPAINTVQAIPDFPEEADPAAARRLLTLYRAGVLTGNDAWGSFGASETVTRAEAATLAVRLTQPSARQTFTLQEMPFTLTRFDTAAPGNVIQSFSGEPMGGLVQVGTWTDTGNQSGFINLSNELVIPMQYDWISRVNEGYAGVSHRGQRAILDTQGNTIFTAPKDPNSRQGYTFGVSYGGHGLFLLSSEDGRWGVADRTGKIILPVQYGGVSILSDNLIAANRNWGPCALFDAAGKPLSEAVYEISKAQFQDGRLLIRRDGKYGFLDEQGREVIPAQLHFASYEGFSDGRALVTPQADGAKAYIDTQGNVIVAAGTYTDGSSFSEGKATVRRDGKAMVIETDGTLWKPEITAQFDAIDRFQNGVAWGYKDGLAGLLDAQGNVLITPRYHEVQYSNGTLSRVREAEEELWLSSRGVPLEPQPEWNDPFDQLRFTNGYAVYESPAHGYRSAIFSLDGKQLTPYIFGSVDFGDGEAAPVWINGALGYYFLRAR